MAVLALISQTAFINYAATLNFAIYVQPASFLGYFLFRCLFVELYFRNPAWKGSPWAWALTVAAFVGLYLIPSDSTQELLAGWSGLALCLFTIIAVGVVAFLPEPTGLIPPIAKWFGQTSYPVYLLHPIAYQLVIKYGGVGIPVSLRITMVVASTVALSEFANRFVEKPAIRFSRKMFR